jgi:hypothetical protein
VEPQRGPRFNKIYGADDYRSADQEGIVIFDRTYAEKADSRQGGVGTETQIISPEIYAKADQNKFVGVASEVGDDGKPFLPTFYKSRIYIDLSQSDIYAANFDQLLRWIYDKPTYPKPPLGRRPEFLNENAVKGHDTRALQAYLGHKNIQHTVRYTELSPTRFKDFWRK